MGEREQLRHERVGGGFRPRAGLVDRGVLWYNDTEIPQYWEEVTGKRMASLLKISDATKLALHAMVYLAGRRDETVTASEIAAFLSSSEAHLAKVLQRLVRAGLVRSVRGPKGGYALVDPAGASTPLTLYEVFEGTFPKGDCLFDAPICNRSECMFDGLLAKLGEEVRQHLAVTTVDQLSIGRDSVIDREDSEEGTIIVCSTCCKTPST
jgi:Rrf2 family protein